MNFDPIDAFWAGVIVGLLFAAVLSAIVGWIEGIRRS